MSSEVCKTISTQSTFTSSSDGGMEEEKVLDKPGTRKVVTIKEKSRSNSPDPRRQSGESKPQLERMKRKSSQIECTKSDGPNSRTKQVTLMLFIITVVFILSFIPHLVLMVINAMNSMFVKDMSPVGIAFYNIFLRSFVINNMANPIIYGFCDKKFRTECSDLGWEIITFCRC
jgi:hypothetical protein